MIDRRRFGLNRIIAPSLELREFFDLAASVGVFKVELRNDIRSGHPLDDLPPAEVKAMAADAGVEIISINALQKFNLASARAKALPELEALLDTATSIECRAVVLCPNNEPDDERTTEQRARETTESLSAFGPLFTKAGVMGLVEPLGFTISSLASLMTAKDCIEKSGFGCYLVVHDTFHHFIGPDETEVLDKEYDVTSTGLVHVSGVEAGLDPVEFRDEHRVLVGPADRMKTKEQIRLLDRLGFTGDFSFEPFSPEVQKLSRGRLADAVKQSLDFIMS